MPLSDTRDLFIYPHTHTRAYTHTANVQHLLTGERNRDLSSIRTQSTPTLHLFRELKTCAHLVSNQRIHLFGIRREK